MNRGAKVAVIPAFFPFYLWWYFFLRQLTSASPEDFNDFKTAYFPTLLFIPSVYESDCWNFKRWTWARMV
ncbi:MAG: hypothetical protein J0M29_12945 [Chitinophagales bacterium]|nr:hypothetical protein [Chitinophagales bacterium]